MTTSGALIATQELTRTFGSGNQAVSAVKSVSLDVSQGDFLAVVGRSGSGKTTLLNLMAGLDRPSSGRVAFEGADLTSMSDADLTELRKRSIGFVFQSFGLMPLLSAYENVELPLHIRGVGWREPAAARRSRLGGRWSRFESPSPTIRAVRRRATEGGHRQGLGPGTPGDIRG